MVSIPSISRRTGPQHHTSDQRIRGHGNHSLTRGEEDVSLSEAAARGDHEMIPHHDSELILQILPSALQEGTPTVYRFSNGSPP